MRHSRNNSILPKVLAAIVGVAVVGCIVAVFYFANLQPKTQMVVEKVSAEKFQ
jgi:hypothetical protein